MRCLRLGMLLACVAALFVVAGCGGSKASTGLDEPDGELPTVITADITDIKLHTGVIKLDKAVVGGEVTDDGGSAVTERGFVWRLLWAGPTVDDNKIREGGGTGSFSSVMAELESRKPYNVRAYATNDRGTAYGANRRFRTSQGTVTDIDGNEYEIVRVGERWWMAENLRVTRYRNGDAIPTNLTAGEWQEADYGAYTIYPSYLIDGLTSDAEVVDAYGNLYNWFTVDDPRGVCPEGWRVPGEGDWNQLVSDVGGDPGTFGVPGTGGEKLKSWRIRPASHPRWAQGGLADNDFGWSALPGGRALWDGHFSGIGTHGNWLSATALDAFHSWSRFLWSGNSRVHHNYSAKQNGNSIRCFKDAEEG
jgi:uncharacterized protein (TIGR02145 family)